MIERYHLGCPVWGHRAWVGELFTRDAEPADFLRQYASVFNTVEGNTTFYGLPRPSTVARWREEAPRGFRFCFKFPRTVSHEGRLDAKTGEALSFLTLLSSLEDRLGPFMLQLPPSFGPESLPALERFLDRLPSDFDYAVELRHATFFAGGSDEARLDAMLRPREIDRVIFDARGLNRSDPKDPAVLEAQRRKPNHPVRRTVTGRHPMVRYVAHAEIEPNRWLLMGWAAQLAEWIEAGLSPYIFVHAPDEFHAPALARILHERLATRLDVGEMPAWPAEREPPVPKQLDIFGQD